MDTIRKITVSYDQTEDRLRLAYQNDNGDAKGLWLTQRLTNRLVSALLSGVDQGRGSSGAALRAWDLSVSRGKTEPGSPVELPETERHPLVSAIDITRAGTAMRLVFRCGDDLSAALTIDDVTIFHQWLDILHQQYRHAGWPQNGLWRDWFDAADRMAMPRPPNLLLN